MFHIIKILNQRIRWIFLLSLGFATLSFMGPISALGAGPAPVDLGSAGDFAILAKSAITTTGTTSISGDIGISPNSASDITGFGLTMDSSGEFSTSALVNGRIYAADYAPPTPSNMTTAISDMENAYTYAAGVPDPTETELGSGNIGGMTLAPGLYKWSTGVNIPTDLTLSGGASDVWIFQIEGDLTIASDQEVVLSGGALASNVFWQVGGGAGAVLNTGSTFNGTILSATQINLRTGAMLNGRALAQTQVTLDGNLVSEPCPLIILSPEPPLPQGTEGVAYSETITASGGAEPYTFTMTAGSLPSGLSPITTDGVIAGTPTDTGTFTFTVTATDDNSCTGLQEYTLVINADTCPAITLSPESPLPQGTEGVAYSQTITASGGTAPYTFDITAGVLPAGLLFSSDTGVISGTPTDTGTFTFTVTATDDNSCTGLEAYTLVINADTCPTITLSPAPPLPQGTVGGYYSRTISASGGTAPYTFDITAGALPSGLSLSSGGIISGTPTAAGTFNFTVTATDDNGCTGLREYTITINLTATPIPTLSEWGMIFFIMLLGLTSIYYLRKRKMDF